MRWCIRSYTRKAKGQVKSSVVGAHSQPSVNFCYLPRPTCILISMTARTYTPFDQLVASWTRRCAPSSARCSRRSGPVPPRPYPRPISMLPSANWRRADAHQPCRRDLRPGALSGPLLTAQFAQRARQDGTGRGRGESITLPGPPGASASSARTRVTSIRLLVRRLLRHRRDRGTRRRQLEPRVRSRNRAPSRKTPG